MSQGPSKEPKSVLSWREKSGQGDLHGRVDPMPAPCREAAKVAWGHLGLDPALRGATEKCKAKQGSGKVTFACWKDVPGSRESGLEGVGVEAGRPIRRLSKYCNSKPICHMLSIEASH